VQGSQICRVYTHLQDTDRAILELNGLVQKSKDKEGKFKAVECPRCKTSNPYGSKFCSQCSMGLDLESIQNFEKVSKTGYDVMDILQNNPDVHDQAVILLQLLKKTMEEDKK